MNDSNWAVEPDIKVLTGNEAIRRHPLMYFGPDPINQMVFEVIDMSIEAALRGTCKHIIVTLKPDNVVKVEDDSEGLPIDVHQHTQLSTLEIIFTRLYTPGYSFPQTNYYVT